MNSDQRFQVIGHLSQFTDRIRNISIIAHVDHGKTTLTDQLISSNNIISKKLAGNLRYMDHRPDEQLRGITMKSSSISIIYGNQLVNLIDSPGHIEFSSEVQAALRLTDGALVLIDVLEGFSSRTFTVLKQMYEEGIKGILVLNKVDRLILEQQMDPDSAYMHLSQIIDQVNATLSSFLNEQIQVTQTNQEFSLDDENILEIESKLYFSPEKNNVVFCSSIDSWAFTIGTFAEIFSQKLKCSQSALQRCLWGNFYIKNKRIHDKPMKEGQSTVFVDFILKNIWSIYNHRDNLDKLKQIATSLQIDGPIQNYKSVIAKWLPLDKVVLTCVIQQLPNPIQSQTLRMPILAKRLIKELAKHENPVLTQIYKSIECCNKDGPLVIFVAKMISVTPDCIDEKGMGVRPEQVASYAFARVFSGTVRRGQKVFVIGPKSKLSHNDQNLDQTDVQEFTIQRLYTMMAQNLDATQIAYAGNLVAIGDLDDLVFKTATISDTPICPTFTPAAFGFKSILKTMVLPAQLDDLPRIQQAIKKIYKSDPSLDVETLDSGEVLLGTCGQVHLQRCITDIEKLTQCKLKISDPIIPFKETIIYKNLLEESNLKFHNKKAKVLKTVKKEQKYQDERTKDDDVEKELYMKEKEKLQKLEDSEFAETNKMDYDDIRYNQVIVEDVKWKYNQKQQTKKVDDHKNRGKQGNTRLNLQEVYNKSNLIEEFTANQKISVKVRAVAIPYDLAIWLENNSKMLRRLLYDGNMKGDIQTMLQEFDAIRKSSKLDRKLNDLIENHLYCFGPKKHGPNLLIFRNLKKEDSLIYKLRSEVKQQEGGNQIQQDMPQQFEVEQLEKQQIQQQDQPEKQNSSDSKSLQSETASSIAKGLEIYLAQQEFNLDTMMKAMGIGLDMALTAGPLCGEPIIGACFIVEQIKYAEENEQQFVQDTYGPISGQLISMMKDACLNSFLGAQPRLVESVYKCTLQTNYEHYGKAFEVLAQRRAKILDEILNTNTSLLTVQAQLPLSQSFDFYSAIQTATSGHVSAQLDFDGWVVLDIDPFYQPFTDDDVEENGEQGQQKNIARELIMATRKRKGMITEEKIVVAADKQRNLSRKK